MMIKKAGERASMCKGTEVGGARGHVRKLGEVNLGLTVRAVAPLRLHWEPSQILRVRVPFSSVRFSLSSGVLGQPDIRIAKSLAHRTPATLLQIFKPSSSILRRRSWAEKPWLLIQAI